MGGGACRRALCAPAGAVGNGGRLGLDFPYASRFVNVERRTANIYTTTGACQALLDHHELTGAGTALAAAIEGTRFILDDLGAFELDGHRWLRYWRGEDTPTINVQASAASLLARAWRHTRDERMLEAADEAARTVLALQREDGSWPYANDRRGTFVDGFYTGFTLQGPAEYAVRRGEHAVAGSGAAIGRGLAFFRQHLLNAEGMPLDFADGGAATDGQALGQALQTLVVCGADPEAVAMAAVIWRGGLERLLLAGTAPGERFPSLRWSIGPAVLATAHLMRGAR